MRTRTFGFDDAQRDERAARAKTTHRLLVEAAHASEPERSRLIGEVVMLNIRLAESIARRYSGRGVDRDDLVQVASLGLLNAARRFDPERGQDFLSFAMPTISGEVKRHFRDHAWSVRPPRRVQELHAAVTDATAQIAQTQGSVPTVTEIADHLGVDADAVIEARGSRELYTAASIDHRGSSGEDTPLAALLGGEDGGFDRAEAVVALAPVCRVLRPRDQKILFLRFFEGWTQQEIARELGVTQMQVSRLLARILGQLRTRLGDPESSSSDEAENGSDPGGRTSRPQASSSPASQ